MNKPFLTSLLLLLFAANTFGQPKSFSREQMVQDVDTLFATIEKVHPDMYAVYPKELLAKDIEKVKAELAPSGDIAYFYKQVAPLMAKLGDGHTNTRPTFVGSKDFAHALLFPFSVKVAYPDYKIFVQRDYTQAQNTIPLGAQITSINHRKADSIAQEMMRYVSGEKDFYRAERVTGLFIPLIYTLYGDSIFEVGYMHNQEQHTVQVKGVTKKEMDKSASQRNDPTSRRKNYSFYTLPDKNVGVIEFNAFLEMGKFEKFLEATFLRLQKENIENLIIDVRANGGGNSLLGDELLQYISPVPFTQFGKATIKISALQKQRDKQLFEQLYKREITKRSGVNKWLFKRMYKREYKRLEKARNGTTITHDTPRLIELRKNSLRYKGKVYLLISHRTFSSAAKFSWAFKYFKMGTVVGEETGGMAVSFGDLIFQTLPNTRLSYNISHKKFYDYGATDENTHGTLPDYEVAAEKAMDFTVGLIEKRKTAAGVP